MNNDRTTECFAVFLNIFWSIISILLTVATGFPSGSYPLSTRIREIQYAIEQGATEIDIVIDRSLVLRAEWQKLYDEIVEMRTACGETVHMKTILAVGECGTFENVYKASMVAMLAGANHFTRSLIKDSIEPSVQKALAGKLKIF